MNLLYCIVSTVVNCHLFESSSVQINIDCTKIVMNLYQSLIYTAVLVPFELSASFSGFFHMLDTILVM